MKREIVRALWEAIPIGEANAKTGADIAESVGLNRRTGGIRLNAIDNRNLKCKDNGKGVNVWWRVK